MTTQEILEAARGAKTAVALSDSGTRDSALYGMADALCAPESMDAILAANAEDMAAAKGRISDVMLDRLALTPQRRPWPRASGTLPPCLTRWAGC